MPYLLAGLIVLWLALTGLRSFAKLSPAAAAKVLQQLAGYGAFAVAGLFALRGRIDVAIAVGGLGCWFLGVRPSLAWLGGMGKPTARPRGATSRVRSAMIEMELDHDTGAMRGSVLAGQFQDRSLDVLTSRECGILLAECRRHDPEGGRLLEAYLDRRFAGWRAAGDGNEDAGTNGSRDGRPSPGPMTENEAYEVLGLRKGASRDQITRAHRTLMKKLHPDHGGATHLAARANEAKDVLMRRHT
jgi:DnaJ-domain-containing protein 1